MASIKRFHQNGCKGENCECAWRLDYRPLGTRAPDGFIFRPRRRLRNISRSRRESKSCKCLIYKAWRGGRAVEGTGLENRQRRKSLVGSNPDPLRQRVCDVEHSPENCTESPCVRRLVVSKSEIPTPFAWILSISDFGGGLWRSEH